MKSPLARLVLALVAIFGTALGMPAAASVVASNVITVATADGSITVVSTVDDEFFGDPDRWLFEYQVSGDYDPLPPDSNGISSLQIAFGSEEEDVTEQTGPPDWEFNATSLEPPFGAGWDLPDSVGDGVGPGSGDVFFSFAVPAGTAFTSEDQGSYAASYYLDVPFGLVALIDDTSGEGPIVPMPVPEPTSVLLSLASGVAVLARRRLVRA